MKVNDLCTPDLWPSAFGPTWARAALERLWWPPCTGTTTSDLPEAWHKLAEYAEVNECSLMLCSETLTHTLSIGASTKTNRRGELLEDFICEKGLRIINEGNVPTWRNRINSSIIDLALASGPIESRLRDWKVHTGVHNHSDHCLVECSLNGEREVKYEETRNFEKVDWIAFPKRRFGGGQKSGYKNNNQYE